MDWLSPIRELFEFFSSFIKGVPVIRAILGFILVFFLPGLAWSSLFFKQLKVIERILLSMALSIVVVTLSLLVATRFGGARVNGFDSVLIIIAVTVLPVAAYYLNRFIRQIGRKAA
ncbi:MAG: hypothetical protein V3R96_07405 [Dehalococcoidales bacterium]